MIVACALVAPCGRAGADTASELDDARQKVAQAQADANALASEMSAAEARFEQIQGDIAQLQSRIDDARTRIQVLEIVMRDRAVAAYVKRSGDDEFSALLSTSRPMEAARRARFLEQANQKDDHVVRQLDSLREDLDEDQANLKKEREVQEVVKEQLAAQNDVMQQRLAEASRARDELAARLEREQEAAAAAEAARIRALQAASRPQNVSSSSGGGAGQIIANPGGGSFQCPVSGAAYTDDYGSRGSGFHYGIDMFAPTGTPLVAVKAGTLMQMPMDGAGGNEAYLSADGNVYYYAHLSQYAGGPRSVAQGEVIGYVGMTGNASAPHLHFEIRIGGANGSRIDPYPTLSGAGC